MKFEEFNDLENPPDFSYLRKEYWRLLEYSNNQYNAGLKSALELVKEVDCPHCSDTLICGIENNVKRP